MDCVWNDDLICQVCGYKARDKSWRRNCPALATNEIPPGLPGYELERIFAKLAMPVCGGCISVRNEMNHNGPRWCRDNLAYIVSRIKENAKNLSWADWFKATGAAALAGYTSIEQIVLEAVERAEGKVGSVMTTE